MENEEANPCTWLPEKSWDEICKADNLPAFKNLHLSFRKSEQYWKNIYDNFDKDFEMPPPWNDLNSFRRLIIVRILRSDQLISCLTTFVKNEMDERFIRPPPFSIAVSYSESYCLCPLIFILSPGTDPMSALVKFAQEVKMTDRFKSISLGQGKLS